MYPQYIDFSCMLDIIKETTNKCTITLQLRKKLYSAKLKQLPNTKNWEIDGLIDHWENIDYLLI